MIDFIKTIIRTDYRLYGTDYSSDYKLYGTDSRTDYKLYSTDYRLYQKHYRLYQKHDTIILDSRVCHHTDNSDNRTDNCQSGFYLCPN